MKSKCVVAPFRFERNAKDLACAGRGITPILTFHLLMIPFARAWHSQKHTNGQK
jgi:hypothetical protein